MHGTDYKFSLSLSLSMSIRLCALKRLHFLTDFAKSGTEVTTPKTKNEVVGGQHWTTPSPILPPQIPILRDD